MSRSDNDPFFMRSVDAQGAKIAAWLELDSDRDDGYVTWSMEQEALQCLEIVLVS